MSLSFAPRRVIAAILLAASVTIAGALVFEHGLGLLPCKLCLQQRYPYYLAMVLALASLALPMRRQNLALASLGLIFLVSAGMGVHHAGIEWGFWAGPNDCAGATPPAAGMNEFMRQLESTRVVSCTEAAWRLLGLSLAGWNVLISVVLASAALLPLFIEGRGERTALR